ncbi:MAG TPA: hypothetical protein VMH81_02965 [Bryobacteraceae bacterium]|nr:hypothetical protein [Bryobacteraceae bacterium]
MWARAAWVLKRALVLTAAAAAIQAQTPNPKPDSIYTSLSEHDCKLLSVQEEGANSAQRCPGTGGFSVLVLDSDSRQSITLVSADGRKHPLRFWDVITHSFSSLGPKAEWRVSGAPPRPIALIVRVNANEDADSAAVTSYLAVAKITPSEVCVVARIRPSADANTKAREAADKAAGATCLKPME